MRSGEGEFCLGVSLQTVSGRCESNLSVTRFAAVRVRRSGELSGVRIHVALRTSQGIQLVFRVASGGFVALDALHGRVLAFQREKALLVLFAGV